jgi:predicted RNA-binding protein with PUA-like domain
MAYWLFKSEPNTYSYADLESDGRTEWDGVRNFQARNYLRDGVKEGDRVFFYHSNAKPQAIVGIAKVVRGPYPDFTAWEPGSPHPDPQSTPENPIWYLVDIAPEQALKRPVTLDEVKRIPGLEQMMLIKSSRLSIQPVRPAEWEIVVKIGMGG